MKIILLVFLTFQFQSCGKNADSKYLSNLKEIDDCVKIDNSVPCISAQNGQRDGVDLLETMIDVPIKVNENEIIFLSTKSSVSSGRRIDCKTEVKEGSSFTYSYIGDKLNLTTPYGNYEMQKLSDVDSLFAHWIWKGDEEQGMHVIRELSFLGQNRLIIKTKCEL